MEEITSQQERFSPTRGVIDTLQPLNIDIEDTRLLAYLDNLESKAKEHWDSEDINLTKRREQNFKYLFGKQLKGKKLKKYESEFIDNTLYEVEGILKSLALSKMPDIIINPGVFGDKEKDLSADLLTKYNDNEINKLELKKQLGIMFKHLPVYLISGMKYRWDASRGKNGTIIFEVINPEHLLLDHTALSSNPDEMLFVIHYIEKTGKEWAMLFPKKEENIKKYILTKHPGLETLSGETKDDALLAQKVRVSEVWFDWFDKAEEFDVENPKFNFMSGVAWMLDKNTLLGKTKNPNWDYGGHSVATLNGQPVSPEIMEQVILGGQMPGFEIKKVYSNYFEFPRKPFIFMSYDQFLRSAIDETSRIEQIIPMQKSVDETERSIDYMVRAHKGKHIFSKDSGMTKKDLEKLDLNNPDNDLLVAGIPSQVHSFIQAVMPPSEMFVHAREKRDRIFAKMGTHGATRGEVTTDVATTNQISREADFTKSDDLVDETILHVVTEISKARLHMMKLRYTEEHFKKILGQQGKDLHFRLTNDTIEDGMEVVVSASTTDKLRAERNAQGMAQLNMIDPLTYFQDLGLSDPEGRAERLFLKETQPEMYYQRYILKKDMTEMANQIIQQVTPTLPGQPPMPGEAPPMAPSPTDTSNIPTQPQGGMMSQAMNGIKNLFKR